jgi:ketosteroid isomerase-like protein
MDPEVVFEIDPGSFVAGTYTATTGSGPSSGSPPRSEFQLELNELIDAGDAVLALGRIRARGVKSGATGTQQGALLFRFSNGRIVLYRS